MGLGHASGFVRLLENVELMFWLQEIDYHEWLSIDLHMPRADSAKACQHSVDIIRQLWRLAAQLSATRSDKINSCSATVKFFSHMVALKLGRESPSRR